MILIWVFLFVHKQDSSTLIKKDNLLKVVVFDHQSATHKYHDIAASIDELVSATNSEKCVKGNTSKNTANLNPIAFPDIETICKKKIPTLPLYLSSSG